MTHPTRRHFLKMAAFAPTLLSETSNPIENTNAGGPLSIKGNFGTSPVVISTWDFGKAANEAAWQVLAQNGRSIDAVEAGVKIPEADPNVTTVGYGGFPDRDGRVTLDACIMDEFGKAGSVCAVEGIMHPISLARMVMEHTPHVILVGEGAQQFAVQNGFIIENLLTETAEKAWKEWLKTANYKPKVNAERHDTIGMLALDKSGNLAGGCTTSGMAFKMHGRVGDSPIIGAGLFVDNEIGAATATGLGETVLRTCASFLVVELMRQGKSPQKACEAAIKRIVQKNKGETDFQVGLIAVNRKGIVGAYAVQKGFQYAVCREGKTMLFDAGFLSK
jgi:N4-(beta-N-acetylglucosaminyl)-L-asparaginase